MELVLIRHGQSTNNALDKVQNRVCDPPLTELGRRQAEILAQHLAGGTSLTLWEAEGHNQHGYGITRLYCSPMWRALQTAQPIGLTLGLAPEVWVEVHEHGGIFLDYGEAGGIVGYPGKTRAEMLAEFPNYVLPEGVTDEGWWHGGREDRSACYGRAIKVAARVREQAAGEERIALVSHGDFLDALLKAFFNQLPGRQVYYHHFNAAITRLDFRSDGHLDVQYVNRVDHLPPDLMS
jgi:broad specificity phosphatase PhoE